MATKLRVGMAALLLACAACSRRGLEVPALSDAPVLAEAAKKDLPEFAPGYGIAVPGGQFEVSLEAEDGPRVRDGQEATAYVLPDRRPIACRVTRVLRRVSEETGQSLAWLSPLADRSTPTNEFVYVNILVRTKRGTLTVPASAVLAREGRLYAVRAAGDKFESVEVSTGIASGADIEIASGLAAGEHVVARGGVGYLYPDFKSQGSEY